MFGIIAGIIGLALITILLVLQVGPFALVTSGLIWTFVGIWAKKQG